MPRFAWIQRLKQCIVAWCPAVIRFDFVYLDPPNIQSKCIWIKHYKTQFLWPHTGSQTVMTTKNPRPTSLYSLLNHQLISVQNSQKRPTAHEDFKIDAGFPMDFPWMTHSTRYQPSRIFTMESQVPVYWKPSTAPRIDSARNEAAGCCWPQVKRGKVAISSWGAGKEQICGVVKTCENYGLWLFGDKPKEQQ